jgi:hypothetical protein
MVTCNLLALPFDGFLDSLSFLEFRDLILNSNNFEDTPAILFVKDPLANLLRRKIEMLSCLLSFFPRDNSITLHKNSSQVDVFVIRLFPSMFPIIFSTVLGGHLGVNN